MEIKIGIQSVPRELVLETETTADDIKAALAQAIADGGLFTITDSRGGKIMVPVDKLAYLELVGADSRRVGFGPNI